MTDGPSPAPPCSRHPALGQRRGGGQQHGRLGPSGGPDARSTPAVRPRPRPPRPRRPGAACRMAAATPGRGHHPDHARSRRARTPGGHRWPLRAQAHHVLPGKDHPHRPARTGPPAPGRPPAPARRPCRRRPPHCRRGGPALRPGTAPRRVRLQVGRLDPGGLQGQVPVARAAPRAGSAAAWPLRRPWTLPGAGPGLGEGLARRAQPPVARPARPPGIRAGRCRRRSRPGPGPRPAPVRCGGAALERGPPAAAESGRSRPRSGRRDRPAGPGWPQAASTMVRQPVQRHRWASSAVSTWAGGRRRARARPAGTGFPGVQKPHWLAPCGTNALDQPAPPPPGRARRRWSPTGRPPAAAGSRTPPGARHRPAPCSSRTGPAGCNRP